MAKNQNQKGSYQKANKASAGSYGTEFASENSLNSVQSANAKAEANKAAASGKFAKQQPTE
ncbi:MAG: gamma-type small acid-soluble spore protein [Bacillaceae bacterium]